MTSRIGNNFRPVSGSTFVVNGTANVAADTITNVLTVTTGRTFYCTGVMYSSGAGSSYAADLRVGGTIILKMPSVAGGASLYTGGVIFTATSTQVVDFDPNGNANTQTCSVWGYEVVNN